MSQSPAINIESSISIRDIRVFKLNPRKSPNPLYQEIKDSIRVSGLTTPLHVVLHPEEGTFVLSRGGQTRLTILNELYEETLDQQFLYPSVVVESYVDDSILLLQHVVENKLRSPNTYYDIANSISLVRQILTQKGGGVAPTQESLASYMSQSGLPIRRQSLSGYFYLSDTLSTRVSDTTLLASVVTRTMMDQIRTLRNSLSDAMDGDTFDSSLIHFIDTRSTVFTFSDIKTYINSLINKPRTETASKSKGYFAKRVLSKLGFDPEDVIAYDNPCGFVVRFPSEVENRPHAEALYFLASLSGLLDERSNPELLSKINLNIPLGPNHSSLSELINARCGLSQSDLPSITTRMVNQSNDDAFKQILDLFKSMRLDHLESASTN